MGRCPRATVQTCTARTMCRNCRAVVVAPCHEAAQEELGGGGDEQGHLTRQLLDVPVHPQDPLDTPHLIDADPILSSVIPCPLPCHRDGRVRLLPHRPRYSVWRCREMVHRIHSDILRNSMPYEPTVSLGGGSRTDTWHATCHLSPSCCGSGLLPRA
jgi:hypothetical protein